MDCENDYSQHDPAAGTSNSTTLLRRSPHLLSILPQLLTPLGGTSTKRGGGCVSPPTGAVDDKHQGGSVAGRIRARRREAHLLSATDTPPSSRAKKIKTTFRYSEEIVSAAKCGYLVEVMKLHKDGVSIESTRKTKTSLMVAAKMSHEDVFSSEEVDWKHDHLGVVKYLIECGADLNASTSDGRTAVMIAATYDSEVILKELIDAGALLDERNQDGKTALMLAVESDSRGCVALLLMEGADDTILDRDGDSAFTIALNQRRIFADRVAWDLLKRKVTNLKLEMALCCAAVTVSSQPQAYRNEAARGSVVAVRRSGRLTSAALPFPPACPLAGFSHSIQGVSDVMAVVASYWTGVSATSEDGDSGVNDVRFLSKKSTRYLAFVKAVHLAFVPHLEERDSDDDDAGRTSPDTTHSVDSGRESSRSPLNALYSPPSIVSSTSSSSSEGEGSIQLPIDYFLPIFRRAGRNNQPYSRDEIIDMVALIARDKPLAGIDKRGHGEDKVTWNSRYNTIKYDSDSEMVSFVDRQTLYEEIPGLGRRQCDYIRTTRWLQYLTVV